MAGWKVLTWPPSSVGRPVSSETGRTSTPSAARWSRVPSVAKTSTSSASSSRARVTIPSRLATDSRARTRTSPPPTRDLATLAARARLAAEYSAGRGILGRQRRPAAPLPPGARASSQARSGGPDERGWNVRLLPWEYLFTKFSAHTFPDIYTITWVATIVLLIGLILLYNARTRALHRHAPYLDMYEWLLWTGISLFGLVLVAAVFNSYLIVMLVILFTGLAVMFWVRFFRFPPSFDVYEQNLA